MEEVVTPWENAPEHNSVNNAKVVKTGLGVLMTFYF